MLQSYVALPALLGAALSPATSARSFYDAAICKPPYTMESATALYEAAERLAKPDSSMLTAIVYALPQEFGRDGFKTRRVIFAGTMIGVLVEGLQADALATRYHLTRERSTIFGTAIKGYARALPPNQQPQPDVGTVSIVARESASIPG